MCTGNSCRSQMAEGFLKYLGQDKFETYSAGVDPVEINPLAIKVMQELDLDISGQRAKSIDEFLNQDFDYLITVCDKAKASCPIFSGEHKRIHWDLEDPALASGDQEEKLEVFRKTRDQIKNNVEKLILWLKT